MAVVDEQYLSVAEAAELLKVSRSTLWRWIDRGQLSAYRFGYRRVVIKREDLEQVITPARREQGETVVEKERERLSRPLTKQEQKKALAALEAVRQLKAKALERRGGKRFSDSAEMIRKMRKERAGHLL